MRFQDRRDAGQQLAKRLSHYRDENPIILALPRGGVVVGFEVASALKTPLDIVVARKIGAPFQPELGIGAVAPGGVRILDEQIIQLLNVTEEQIEQITAQEIKEMNRRIQIYRDDRPLPRIQGRVVILVDDGIATGVTAKAAIRSIRLQKPSKIVLAVPVAPLDTVISLRHEVDDLVCITVPSDLGAISLWYHYFEQTGDNEVIELLERSYQERKEKAF